MIFFVDELCQESNVKRNLSTKAPLAKWKNLTVKLTASEQELQDALCHIKNGCPEKKETRADAQAFWYCNEELYVKKGY